MEGRFEAAFRAREIVLTSPLLRRVVTVLFGLPLVLGAVWVGGVWLLLLTLVVAGVGGWEFFRLAERVGEDRPLRIIGVLLILLVVASGGTDLVGDRLVLAGATVTPLLWLLVRRREDPLVTWAVVVAGVLYVGWLLSHVLLLRNLEGGREWLLFALLVTFATDTAAFGLGQAVGRHPMAPTLSPGKTWEGATGGIAGALLAALALAYFLSLPVSGWEALGLGGAVAIAAQLGDLAESMFKRRAGLKEAGRVLPGHGGILDRLDSILLTLPLAYYVVTVGSLV